MRLVDADALMKVFRGEEGAKALDHYPLRLIMVKQIVDNAPTIDAIPITWLEDIAGRYEYSGCTDSADVVMTIIEDWQKEQGAQK